MKALATIVCVLFCLFIGKAPVSAAEQAPAIAKRTSTIHRSCRLGDWASISGLRALVCY